MFGKHTVIIQNRSVHFKFEIERNISIIRGDSATGKTTLIGMVSDYQTQGIASGVQLACDKKCVAMTGLGDSWKDYLKGIKDSIVFIDEGEKYVAQKEFARFIKKTDNYYVIASRNNLYDIPYSVDAVYEVKTSGKYGKLKKTYNSLKKMYGDKLKEEYSLSENQVVIVEDEKSGYQFFKNVSDNLGVNCITAKGKGNIIELLNSKYHSSGIVIADGAVFGPEMANLYGLTNSRRISLFLPESFEWLILDSGIINEGNIHDVLANPSDYIKSEEYFSWEQFFTAYLVNISQNKKYRYQKSSINEYYLSKHNVQKILGRYFGDMNS